MRTSTASTGSSIATPVGAGPKIDGEVALPSAFEPTFVMLFSHSKCRPELPGAAEASATLFECARSGKKSVICTIRSIGGDSRLSDARAVPQHAIDMAIVADTPKMMKLATAVGAIQLNGDLKRFASTLIQPGPPRRVKCNGMNSTIKEWRQQQQQMRDKEDEESGAGLTSNAPSRSEPAPSSASPTHKGLEHGRMCGRDSECESGSCKMENKTRGRCS